MANGRIGSIDFAVFLAISGAATVPEEGLSTWTAESTIEQERQKALHVCTLTESLQPGLVIILALSETEFQNR